MKIAIGIAYSGDGEVDMRSNIVSFHLVSANLNVNYEGREGLNLAIPSFGKGRADVGVGGHYDSGRKVEWCGWILRIKQRCTDG